eukprot:TRINITY_DN40695_c0_g1_i1.p1 TRINITY_DN40695_c0_g1~~TRINITY_DN40695_c0_g1_i1.p1  ORF type:complete len:556 (+),score=121.21 TRINITY_DN40695_c0_g1_i1:150-1817(+)
MAAALEARRHYNAFLALKASLPDFLQPLPQAEAPAQKDEVCREEVVDNDKGKRRTIRDARRSSAPLRKFVMRRRSSGVEEMAPDHMLGRGDKEALEAVFEAVAEDSTVELDAQEVWQLCKPFQFFSRLTMEQALAVIRASRLMKVRAGQFIEREGDPFGHIHVVLSGSVAVQERSVEMGGRQAFVRMIFDGRAFGDGWNMGEDSKDASKGRKATYSAQEDCLLLRVATADYRAAMSIVLAGGASENDFGRLLATQPFLEVCEPLEIEVLARLLETKVFIYGQEVVCHGERPRACYILSQGHCRLRSPNGVAVGDLQPGRCLGIGSLGNRYGFCMYESEVSVVVETSSATFRILSIKALNMLPDVAQGRIQDKVSEIEEEDPIRKDGRDVIRQDEEWQRQKRAIVAEESRCSVRGGVPRGVPRGRGGGRPASAGSLGAHQAWRPAGGTPSVRERGGMSKASSQPVIVPTEQTVDTTATSKLLSTLAASSPIPGGDQSRKTWTAVAADSSADLLGGLRWRTLDSTDGLAGHVNARRGARLMEHSPTLRRAMIGLQSK